MTRAPTPTPTRKRTPTRTRFASSAGWRLGVAAIALALVCAPWGDRLHGTAVDRGRALFSDPAASPGKSNVFSCATCHDVGDSSGARILPGGSLAGATKRTHFWGGQENDLLRSVNDCRAYFMDAPTPWKASDADARALYAFLDARRDGPETLPFTALSPAGDHEARREAKALKGGDAARGSAQYEAACKICHGEPHAGAGKIAKFVPTLPEYMLKTHATETRDARRTAAIEKVRRGAFMSAADSMPPFSPEVLSDESVADILAYLGF